MCADGWTRALFDRALSQPVLSGSLCWDFVPGVHPGGSCREFVPGVIQGLPGVGVVVQILPSI